MPLRKKRKRLAAGFLLSLLVVVLLVGAAEGALRVMESRGALAFKLVRNPGRTVGKFVYDEHLGWRNRAGFSEEHGWPHGTTLERINAEGWRDRSYPLAKEDGVFRIAVLGCSFTYGYAVNVEETYSDQLEVELNRDRGAGDPRVEVINFGVNGFGLDQMALTYEHYARAYDPDLVIVQYGWFNSLRALYDNMWLTEKPAFHFEGDSLVLGNHPVPRSSFRPLEDFLLRHSVLYRVIREKLMLAGQARKVAELQGVIATLKGKTEIQDTELTRLSAGILARLREEVDADGARLLVFVWGPEVPWQSAICREAGVAFIDLDEYADEEILARADEFLYPPPVLHWSPVGHAYAASALANYVRSEGLLDAPALR